MSMIYKYEVIGNRLAFRSAPNSEEDNIILRLETGTTIVGGESKNDWTPCEYDERIGYCMSKYLKLLEVNPDGDFQPSDKEKLDILWKEYLKNNK